MPVSVDKSTLENLQNRPEKEGRKKQRGQDEDQAREGVRHRERSLLRLDENLSRRDHAQGDRTTTPFAQRHQSRGKISVRDADGRAGLQPVLLRKLQEFLR